MLAASGATLAVGAPAALAACGDAEDDEDVSSEREAELLNQVLAEQLAVVEAADAASSNAPGEIRPVIDRLNTMRQQSARALENTIGDLDASPAEAADLVGAESPTEGLARQLEQSIAVSLEAIGEVTPETRLPVHRAIVEDAAALAAIRNTLGEEIAPDAFVLGAPAGEEPA